MVKQGIRVGVKEDRLDRSRRIKELDVQAIQRARCLVVGAGALGNEVLKDLVLSGFEKITIVDMDVVAGSNLNRCVFFRPEDVTSQRSKVEVVAVRAKELHPQVSIETVMDRVESFDVGRLRDFDLVFGCLDNISARLHLNSHCYYARVPYVDGGTDGMRGKVQVVLPPSTPCLQCAMNRSHAKVVQERFSCTGKEVVFYERKMGAEITTTSIIAAMQVREGLKILSDHKEDCLRHVLYYDGMKDHYLVLEVELDPDCPNHG